jgi:hypothetical protein
MVFNLTHAVWRMPPQIEGANRCMVGQNGARRPHDGGLSDLCQTLRPRPYQTGFCLRAACLGLTSLG